MEDPKELYGLVEAYNSVKDLGLIMLHELSS